MRGDLYGTCAFTFHALRLFIRKGREFRTAPRNLMRKT
jgi:hypothetical protein